MSLAAGSLCSGIGGLDTAADAALGSARYAWYTEVDADAAKVFEQHRPSVPNLGNIFDLDWAHAEPVDRIVAGVPCQAVSAAGQRRATDDPRWLWPHTRHILSQVRPEQFAFENVQNLTSIAHGEIWLGILNDLTELGYDAAWCVLGACTVGAAHHRHRVFLLARRRTKARGTWTKLLVPSCGMPRSTGLIPLPTPLSRDWKGGELDRQKRIDRGSCHAGYDLPTAVSLLPTPRAGDPGTFGQYAAAVARWQQIHGPVPEPTEPAPKGGRRLSPAMHEWMMGLPAGHVTNHVERAAAFRVTGNGVMPQQGAAAYAALAKALSL